MSSAAGTAPARAAPAMVGVNSGSFLQCEVAAYRPVVCAEAALDYRRFAVSRLATEESEVSQC
jgi:hypothetical protein